MPHGCDGSWCAGAAPREEVVLPSEGEIKLFMDGSCKAPLSCYAGAAGAIMQFDSNGALVRGITFVVPAVWPQTAAAAEHLALR